MAHQFLDDPDVDPVFQHVGGKRVSEGMTTHALGDAGSIHRRLDRLLKPGFEHEENQFVKVLPNAFFGYWRVTVEQSLTDEEGNDITSRDGSPKPDPKLCDYENIPFLMKDRNGNLTPQTIEEYVEREVKPHLPKMWVDESKTKIGYEISFTKYFHEFKPLRSLAEIKADILALETSSLELENAVLED